MGQETASDLTEHFCLGASPEAAVKISSQSPKAVLGLEKMLPWWLSHIAGKTVLIVVGRLSSFPEGLLYMAD